MAPLNPKDRLIEWAMARWRRERRKLAPRVAAVRSGRLVHHAVAPALGIEGLARAAAALVRTVEDHDFVMALWPNPSPGARWDWVGDIRSRAGGRALVILRDRRREPIDVDPPDSIFDHLGDWSAAGYPVDPGAEARIAS